MESNQYKQEGGIRVPLSPQASFEDTSVGAPGKNGDIGCAEGKYILCKNLGDNFAYTGEFNPFQLLLLLPLPQSSYSIFFCVCVLGGESHTRQIPRKKK